MTMEAETAAATVEFRGRTYFFCSERCRKLFEEHPGWFVPVEGQDDHESAGASDD